MIYWNQERVDRFMSAVSSGFIPASPLEVLQFTLFALTALLVFQSIVRVLRSRHNSGILQKVNAAYCQRVGQLQLTPGERDLLEQIYANLQAQDLLLPTDRNRLLDDAGFFELGRRSLLKAQPGLDRALRALGIRLGYGGYRDGRAIRDSAHIPVGTLLSLCIGSAAEFGIQDESDVAIDRKAGAGSELNAHGMIDGDPILRVHAVQPAHVHTVALDPTDPRLRYLRKSRALQFCFRRADGYYRFASSVLNGKQLPDGLHIILSHVGTMERVQQRAYFRRNVQLTGLLQGYDCRITNLSGGGARVRLFPRTAALNDTDPLGEGQECELKFTLNETVVIECRVRIVACNLSDVHLEFTRIREGDRDRIVRHLNHLAHHAISPS